MTQKTLDEYSESRMKMFSDPDANGDFRLEKFLGDLSGVPDNMEFEFETDLPLPVGPLQCPYCWNESRINDYLIPKKQGMGFLKKSVQCPNCKNIMRRNTLIKNTICSYEEYAIWLYWTAKYDADRRVKWASIFEAMKKKQVSGFWEIYRAYKEKMLKKKQSETAISAMGINNESKIHE